MCIFYSVKIQTTRQLDMVSQLPRTQILVNIILLPTSRYPSLGVFFMPFIMQTVQKNFSCPQKLGGQVEELGKLPCIGGRKGSAARKPGSFKFTVFSIVLYLQAVSIPCFFHASSAEAKVLFQQSHDIHCVIRQTQLQH